MPPPPPSPTADAVPEPAGLVAGTAGHIDHGKSSLVARLTGIDPDRLPEEKARGMTIDLGFAHLDIAGRRLGLVDVPGHERFVRTMVAGATGIDLALVVVAADDGVMPQTREHVDVLDLLGVRAGLLVVTKVDLVPAGRVAEVESAWRAAAVGTGLADLPMVAVSNRTGEGFDRLRAALAELVVRLGPRRAGDVFRLPVDRSFSVPGRGTVVTGTVLAGSLATGREVELLPGGRTARVRGLQSHHADRTDVPAGTRVAAALAGLHHDDIRRGDELAEPGALTPSFRVDVLLHRFAGRTTSGAAPVADPQQPRDSDAAGSGPARLSRVTVRVLTGTREDTALMLMPAGGSPPPRFAQLRFRQPVPSARGQPFILRDETAAATVGGGMVLRPVGKERLRFTADDVAGLSTLADGSPSERVAMVLRDAGQSPLTAAQIAIRAGVLKVDVPGLAAGLMREGKLLALSTGAAGGAGVLLERGAATELEGVILAWFERHHRLHPRKLGAPRTEVASALADRITRPVLDALLVRLRAEGRIAGTDDALHVGGRTPPLADADRRLHDGLEAEIRAGGFAPPEPAACACAAGVDAKRLRAMVDLLVAERRLVPIGPEFWLHADHAARLKPMLAGAVARRGPLAVKDIRDLTGSTRRYVVPLLEWLDRTGVTRRVGDARVMK